METLVTEQYYCVLLWRADYDDARDYALRMAERAQRARVASAPWTVRAADASFYRHDNADARELYQSALEGERDWGALREIYLKLSPPEARSRASCRVRFAFVSLLPVRSVR